MAWTLSKISIKTPVLLNWSFFGYYLFLFGHGDVNGFFFQVICYPWPWLRWKKKSLLSLISRNHNPCRISLNNDPTIAVCSYNQLFSIWVTCFLCILCFPSDMTNSQLMSLATKRFSYHAARWHNGDHSPFMVPAMKFTFNFIAATILEISDLRVKTAMFGQVCILYTKWNWFEFHSRLLTLLNCMGCKGCKGARKRFKTIYRM